MMAKKRLAHFILIVGLLTGTAMALTSPAGPLGRQGTAQAVTLMLGNK